MLDPMDYITVQQVLARAAQAVDRGDGAAFAELLTADVTMTTLGLEVAVAHSGARTGRDAVAATIAATWDTLQGQCRHWTGVPVITETVTGVETSSYLMVLRAGEAPHSGVILTGTYLDRFVREDGMWKIAQRQVQLDPAPGDVTIGSDPLVLRRDEFVRGLRAVLAAD